MSSLDLTGAGRSPCTPLYAAPEQLRGAPQPQSDLYALGLLLATMLDGEPPYHALSGPDLVAAQLNDAPVPWGPRTEASPLCDIIAIACQKDAARRFDTARKILLATDPDEATVKEVAERLGFQALGRFASQYRHQFGEYPAETLRRLERTRVEPIPWRA
jgi:serine/threonine protein kinase